MGIEGEALTASCFRKHRHIIKRYFDIGTNFLRDMAIAAAKNFPAVVGKKAVELFTL